MKTLSTSLKALTCAIFIMALSSLAQAQATRTWVSGVGADDNPCSRTAPCKTFAGAILKTAIAGEISVIDPGGYGTLTITKSLTVDGGAEFASTLASATTGFIINIPSGNALDPERRVTLRRLSINGTGKTGSTGLRTGIRGIRIDAAKDVFVENCYIAAFVNEGIKMAVAETGSFLYVKDTNIQNCVTGISVTTSTGFAVAHLDNVRVEKMTGNGLTIAARGHAHVRKSIFVNNGGDGIGMANTVADGTVNVEDTFIGSNGAAGIRNGTTGSLIDISNTSIMQNATGIATASAAPGGGVNSHGNNRISGNAAAGTTPNPVGQQ